MHVYYKYKQRVRVLYYLKSTTKRIFTTKPTFIARNTSLYRVPLTSYVLNRISLIKYLIGSFGRYGFQLFGRYYFSGSHYHRAILPR